MADIANYLPIHIINLGKKSKVGAFQKQQGINYIPYGDDNLLPNRILQACRESPTNSGIIYRKTDFTCGKDITWTPEANNFANNIDGGGGLKELVPKITLDLFTYGGFCLQILWNQYVPNIANIIYQDFSQVRVGTSGDKDSLEEGVWISEDWAQTSNSFSGSENQPVFFPFYNPAIKEARPTYLYYKQYTQGLGFYPLPSWWSAFNSIILEAELINFQLNNILNSFVPSGILKMPFGLAPEQQAEFKRQLQNELKGTDNAGKILTIFKDGEKQVEWIPFNSSPAEKSIKEYLDNARQDIIIAHRLPSPTLVGLPGGATIGGDGNTIASATQMFYDMEINGVQIKIENLFNKLFKQAGIANPQITIISRFENQTSVV